MHTITITEFLQRVAATGITLDPDCPDSYVPRLPTSAGDRFWPVPREPECRPYFLARLLALMGDWQACYVWRPHGSWPAPAADDDASPNDRVEHCIFRALGIPAGTADVLVFDRADLDTLLTLLFATTVFAWSQPEDLFVVPDHGRQILQTDHHDVIHISFAATADLQRWVDAMAADDFPLPIEPPDATFKWPSWMPRRPG